MKKLAVLFVLFTIISCKSNSELTKKESVEALNYHIAISENNKVILESSDTNNIKRVQAIILNRKPLIRKIMPIFNIQISIKMAGSEQVWLFAKPNYIMRKSSENNQVYSVEENLVELLK